MAFVSFFVQQVMDFMRPGLSLLSLRLRLNQAATGEDPVAQYIVSAIVFIPCSSCITRLPGALPSATIGAPGGWLTRGHYRRNTFALRAFLRVTIGYSLSSLLLGFGFLMVLWTPEGVALHDNLFKPSRSIHGMLCPSDYSKDWLKKLSEENTNPNGIITTLSL
jgi:hypothetical protein